MSAKEWTHIWDLFQEAVELSTEEREAFLARTCEGNESLRREVELLLLADDDAGDFIGDTVRRAASIDEAASPPTPSRIGPFEILEELGRGGMGVVYLAQRTDRSYLQKVALKLMHWSLEESEHVRRFEIEREILANLNHPSIARLMDGGELDDGRPWLAMEWVEGSPIGKWCDERRLSAKDRVRIFCKVCDAVGYAHRNLVVHRDLKPSNILVTSDGSVKLIDFGMAKLLEASVGTEAITQTGVRPLTPEYASPEQVRGEVLGTATDIYSLGVVLYELLTGKRPYQIGSTSIMEVERIVCREDPTRPSDAVLSSGEGYEDPEARAEIRRSKPERLRRWLSGDLDNIVLKAMQKETARRYASTERFSGDLDNYLAGRPVSARADTWSYRAGKFAARNRTAVAATAVVAIALVVSAFVSMHFATQASRQRDLAEQRFEEVRSLAMTFLEDVDRAIVEEGKVAAREKIAATGLDYLDRLSSQAGDDVSFRKDLARGYLKVADIQANWLEANLGRVSEARESAEKGAGLARKLFEELPDDPEIGILHVRGEDLIGVLSHHEGQLPYNTVTGSIVESVRVICEELPAALESVNDELETITLKSLEKDPDRRYQSAMALSDDIERHLTKQPILARPSSTIYQIRKLVARNKLPFGFVATVVLLLIGFGIWMSVLFARAETARKESEAVTDFLSNMLAAVDPGEQGRDVTVREVLDEASAAVEGEFGDQKLIKARLQGTIGKTYMALGLYDEAETHLSQAWSVQRDLLGDEDATTLQSLQEIGDLKYYIGEYASSESLYVGILEARKRTLGAEHTATYKTMADLAIQFYVTDRYEEAEKLLVPALEALRERLGDADEDVMATKGILASVVLGLGDHDRAKAILREVLETNRAVLGDEHPRTIETLSSLGGFHWEMGEYAEAESCMSQALAIGRKVFGEDHRVVLESINELAVLHFSIGKNEEAEEGFRNTVVLQRSALGDDHPDVATTLSNLGSLYSKTGRNEEAIHVQLDALAIRRRAFDPDHGMILNSLNNVAAAYYNAGQMQECAKYMREAVEGRTRAFGADHPQTLKVLSNLGTLKIRLGEYEEADSALTIAHRGLQRSLGEDNAAAISTLGKLSLLRIRQSRFLEAESLGVRALSGALRVTPDDAIVVGRYRLRIGEAALGLGKLQEAEKQLLEAHSLMLEANGSDYLETVQAVQLLVETYKAMGSGPQVDEWRARLSSRTSNNGHH